MIKQLTIIMASVRKLSPQAAQEASRGRRGSITVVGLILAFVGVAMVATYLSFSAHDMRLTRISIDQDRTMMMAEAGLDHGVMRLRDIILDYQLSPVWSPSMLQAEINKITPPPGIDEYQYLTPDGSPAFRIEIASPVINGALPNGMFRNYEGSYQLFLISSGCINTNTGRSTVLQQVVHAISLSLIRFGVFYSEDLEILPGADMVFDGPVHSNADMYLGGPLRFNQRVTAAGQVFHHRKNDGSRHGNARIANPAGQLLNMSEGNTFFDSNHPSWTSLALSRWEGQIQSREHGVSDLAPPINPMHNPQDLIRRPILDTEDPAFSTNTEEEKFANKAALRILLDEDGNLVVTDVHDTDLSSHFQDQPTVLDDGNGLDLKDNTTRHYLLSGDGIVSTSARFFDQREQRTNQVIDIYLDRLQAELPDIYDSTIYGDHTGVIYVSAPHEEGWVVRLRNGTELVPQQGLSFASDLPVYIEGDYNIDSPKPALVAGDAVTILSRNWQDVRSTEALGNRQPQSTEVRTVIMTGNTETTWGRYNGGLENVLRFLEAWSGHTLTYRGSIIVLWYSDYATGEWRFGAPIYNAPNRNWGYDPMYLNQIPPGMTRVFGMEELFWTRVNWDDVNW